MAVAAVWGTEFVQFLAALAVLHSDEWKNRMNCTRMMRRNNESIQKRITVQVENS